MAREERKPAWGRRLGGSLAPAIPAFFVAAILSTPARAVPIPWLNCGGAGDPLQITQADASAWPPTVAAPARATATFDASGRLLDLHLFLIQGVPWEFDSGPLPTTTSGGFVSLPPSFAAAVTAPALPLAAGPYITTQTFTDNGASETIVEKANVAVPIDAPAAATVGLSFNGSPGFTLVPAAGDVYHVHVQADESGGARIFCMDMTIPLKNATPLVTSQVAAPTPALSAAGAMILTALLLGTGVLIARRRLPRE